jgi:RNA polymerase sigma-70 factor (ECF subfamily)
MMNHQDLTTGTRRTLESDFVELLTCHRRSLFRTIFYMVRNVPDAEEIFQQTAITLWDKFSSFEPGTDFEAWGSVVARYKVRDFLKSKARQCARFSDEVIDVLASDRLIAANNSDQRLIALEECRKKLPSKDQQLLAECYQQDASIVEVARRNGRPVNRLYDSLWRIRRTLLACIRRTLASEDYV